MSSPEELKTSPEVDNETMKSSADRLEELRKSPEKSNELSQRDIESKIEKARDEALENANQGEKTFKKPEKKSPTSSRRGSVSKKELNKSYRRTIKQVQSDLPSTSRIFSKVIHNPIIEKTSEIAGSTIARPNAILYGAITAFLLTLGTYTIAKINGYPLSGSETILAFAIGWVLGLLIDYVKVLFTGKNNDLS